MAHRVLLDVNPNSFALMVVAGMAAAGLMLGMAMDGMLARLGIDSPGRSH